MATGRWTKGAERLTARASRGASGRITAARSRSNREVDDRRREQREQLREHETADHRDAERLTKLGAAPGAERERERAEQRGGGRHHDGTKAQETRLVDRLARRETAVALRLEREVDHHDRVLLHDADQQHEADQGGHVEREVCEREREEGTHAGRRKRREDRDRMDEALVEHAEHDEDREQRGDQQRDLVRERRVELRDRSLQLRVHARG